MNVIEMKNITKRFGNFTANDQISISLKKGEILALLGENGAGKSTLMGMLSGLLQPTSGHIYVNNQEVTLKSPKDANHYGIGMVHQHFMLIPAFTVIENIILGDEPLKNGMINYNQAVKEITALAAKYDLQIDLKAKVANITVGMQQRVEIMKALYRKADVFIFDEPTASLTPQEITQLMKIFRLLADEGKAIIFITHKLKEIKAAADRCVVIRTGKVIDTVDVAAVSEAKMAEMMVGRHITDAITKDETDTTTTTLQVTNLTVKKAGLTKVNHLSFTVQAGEIVGIAGVDGNGQTELINALTGLQKVTSGSFKINNRDLTNHSAREIIEANVGYIPEDRQTVGTILEQSIAENISIKDYYQAPKSKWGILNHQVINQIGKDLINRFDIRSTSEKEPVKSLSGGNQQKVVVAREIAKNPTLLIAANPTRGVDVGAIEYIHNQINSQRNKGKSVLLVSFELDEILKLSDRVIVMHQGEIVGEIDPQNTSAEELGLLIAGKKALTK